MLYSGEVENWDKEEGKGKLLRRILFLEVILYFGEIKYHAFKMYGTEPILIATLSVHVGFCAHVTFLFITARRWRKITFYSTW